MQDNKKWETHEAYLTGYLDWHLPIGRGVGLYTLDEALTEYCEDCAEDGQADTPEIREAYAAGWAEGKKMSEGGDELDRRLQEVGIVGPQTYEFITWDWKQQIPAEELDEVLQHIPGARVAEINTGCDSFAIVVHSPTLQKTAEEWEALYHEDDIEIDEHGNPVEEEDAETEEPQSTR